jgi:small ligand-binding sensory domain FIST
VNSEFSTAEYWQNDFDEDGLRVWAEKLRAQLGARPVSLGLVFMSPKFFPHAQATLEILRVHARIPLLAGCSSASLVAGSKEIEDATGIVLALYSLPGAELKGFRFTQTEVEEAGDKNRTAGSHSLTRSISTRKAGFVRGTRPMRRCPFLADWRAGFFPSRRRRFI